MPSNCRVILSLSLALNPFIQLNTAAFILFAFFQYVCIFQVAIGEGRTALECLGQCDEAFSLSVLQKALKVNTFSKWLSRIQIKEIEKADIEGLEQCPFCPFATIMDTLPEQNKLFACQNPDCGKESCRLCKEFSHIPLRCEEVEKDAEVRKRTYIEKKMTEAMIRKCYKCSKPFVKADGCNKMTCDCGASMCYLCRQPVRDYKHFFGQGGVAQAGQTCPLWSDNNSIHERDVARGALEAKSEMDKENPEVKLKHDPTNGINLEQAAAGMKEPNPKKRKIDPNAQLPPGLVGVLPDNQVERQRIIREQEHIEAVIRGQGGARGVNLPAPPRQGPPPPFGGFNAMARAMLNNVMARQQQLQQIQQQQQQQRQQQLLQLEQQQLRQQRQQKLQLEQQQLRQQRQQQLQLEQQQFQQQLQQQKQERDEKARMQREAYERKRAMAQYNKSKPKKR